MLAIRFVQECQKRNYIYVKPIITPRFTISCTDDYMKYMGELAKEYKIPVQSHLSENLGEIEFVKELRAGSGDKFYGESYDKYGLFGGEVKTIMAHQVILIFVQEFVLLLNILEKDAILELVVIYLVDMHLIYLK